MEIRRLLRSHAMPVVTTFQACVGGFWGRFWAVFH